MNIIITDSAGKMLQQIPELAEDVYVLGLDGSTTRSGVCVMSLSGQLGFVCACIRGSESIAEYKVSLKSLLLDIINRYGIEHTAYEEPFIGFAGNVKGLFMIASTLEEILAETGQSFRVTSVNNKRWKRQFLEKKLEGGSEVQKRAVREKAIALAPGLAVLRENKSDYDETDAFGLAYYLAKSVRDDTVSGMESKGKPRKFNYVVRLCGGRISASEAVQVAGKAHKDGVIISDITQKRSFDTAVYTLMKGKDAVLLLHFNSGKFGNLIMEYEAGALASENEVLSAVVTRKSSTSTRKKKEV